MEEEIKEKNFFKKAWISIKDFEGYEEFAADKILKTIKYILILSLLFTIFITFAYTYKFYLAVQSIKSYIAENVEDINLKRWQIRGCIR